MNCWWQNLEHMALINYDSSATFMKSYFTNELQRCKRNNSYSEWGKVPDGVPQSSALGLLLFNVFINVVFLFLLERDVENYADGSTVCTSDQSMSNIITP